MKLTRWILFIPLAALSAIVCGILWSALFTGAYYSQSNVLLGILGLMPLFLGRLLPVALFVLVGTAVVPSRIASIICLLGVLGGIYGWPFGPQYSEAAGGSTFYVTEVIGAIVGSATGVLIAFYWSARRATMSAKDGSKPLP